jgi:transglutaminase-like putative cysteine protease
MIRHIRVAVGRDYNDLPPVSGVYESKGGARRMAYELDVTLASENGADALAPTSSVSK